MNNLVALRANMSHVTFRGILRCLIGSRASYGHHGSLLGFALRFLGSRFES